ncbi:MULTISPECIES: membrane protein [unclassified Streptomyces]|uniref:membrane protein n=1 Tax=unclassified Streptomyces TaxID=2593676 RepID=UPI0004C50C2B|nr:MULTISPECIES: membrane protein [unclassified Streptomyces]
MYHSSLGTPDRGPRTPGRTGMLVLVVGVLLVQLGFLLSYIGSFHHPEPQRIPLAVAGPQQAAQKLDALPGEPVRTTVVKDEAAARKRIMERDAEGAYVMDPRGSTDTLLVASGAGGPQAQALRKAGERVAAEEDRTVRVQDVAPSGDQDYESLTAFYLIVGWLVGGYLVASLLGVTAGTRPASTGRAGLRLAGIALYSVLSGLGGAIIVDTVLGALPGHFVQLWWLGALLVFGTAAVTMALEAFFGIVGIGLAVVLFVVLGNPSAGGAFQKHLVPPFWRAIGDWIPTGAGTTAVRNIVYFSGNALATPLVVLAVWAAAGTLLLLAGSVRRREPVMPLPL